jgi:hypothetical protein
MPINETIDKIATIAAKNPKLLNVFKAYYYIGFPCCPPLDKTWENNGLEWEIHPQYENCGYALMPSSKDKFRELNDRIYSESNLIPKLNSNQISETLSEYEFYLPVEFYELCQRANGMFPIGLENRDWDSFDNYFLLQLTDWSETIMNLQDAIYIYRCRLQESVNSGMFPLMTFESKEIWTIEGNREKQEENAIIYSIRSSDAKPEKIWNSISEMLSELWIKPNLSI